MMPLESWNTPPGLYRQHMVFGKSFPMMDSRKAMWVMSSRLMIAPSFFARANSSAGVSLDENMMCAPSAPTASESRSSAFEEQSKPKS